MARSRRNPISPSSKGRVFARLPKGISPVGNEARLSPIYYVGPGDNLGWNNSFIVAYFDWNAGPFSAFDIRDVQEYRNEKEALTALRSGRYQGMPGMFSPPYALWQLDHSGNQGIPPRVLHSAPFELDLLAKQGEVFTASPYDYPYSRDARSSSPFGPSLVPSTYSEYFGSSPFPGNLSSSFSVTPEQVLEMTLQEAWQESLRMGDGFYPADPIAHPFPRKNSLVSHYAGITLDDEIPYADIKGAREERAVPPVPPTQIQMYAQMVAERLVSDVKDSDLSKAKKAKMNKVSKLAFRILPAQIRGDVRVYILDWKLADEPWRYNVQSQSLNLF
jgi:hypothetical protein